MVMWHIDRVEIPADGAVALECFDEDVSAKYYLRDLESGAQATDIVCTSTLAGHENGALEALTTAGFTPNDWSG